LTTKQTREFWSWFEAEEFLLKSLIPKSAEWQELDRRVRALGVDAWEIGPATASSAQYMFALSPNGDRQRLQTCREIVSNAPSIAGWEFHASKPRKFWKRRFQWSGKDVDASKWRFVVYRYDDGKSDIVALGDDLPMLESSEQQRIVEFVVESELGEAQCLDRVNQIEIEPVPSEKDADNSISVGELFQIVSGSSEAN
jgi:hypothetical protein